MKLLELDMEIFMYVPTKQKPNEPHPLDVSPRVYVYVTKTTSTIDAGEYLSGTLSPEHIHFNRKSFHINFINEPKKVCLRTREQRIFFFNEINNLIVVQHRRTRRIALRKA